MKPLLLAFHGLPGTGKDTAANRLTEGGGWTKVSFAAPLKRGLSTMLNIPMEDIENPSLKNAPDYKFGRSIRYMLQSLGTEWGRNTVADDIWLQLAKENILHQFQQGMSVVNTDLRFENEARMVKELGGYVIKLVRDNNVQGEISMTTGLAQHASNAELPDEFIDHIIYNNYSVTMFEEEVMKYLTDLLLKRS